MINKRHFTHSLVSPLALTFLLTLPMPAIAQDPQDGGVALTVSGPTSILRGPLGELAFAYRPLSREEIDRRIDASRANQDAAAKDLEETRGVQASAAGRVKIMTEEIRTTKTRLSVAKKLKNESDRLSLEKDLKRQEAELKYLERLRDSADAEAAALQSQDTAAKARVKALELELDAASQYEKLTTSPIESPDSITHYKGLLKQLLEAQQDAGRRARDAGSKQEEVASLRLKQFDALAKLQ